jgi:glyoxylase-like metal-dependent hydrolase (beta-lactamase superfamily II)
MKRSFPVLVAATLLALTGVSQHGLAQFGPPEPEPPGPRLPTPTVFPEPGTYPTTESVTLLDADPNAIIHYTLDGSEPNSKSPVYDPTHLLFIGGVYDGMHGLKTGYTIRAHAYKQDHASSETATFLFTVDRRDHTAYVSEIVRPGVRMIRDSDNDKMFLFCGTRYCALIDSGMGRGELRKYVEQYTHGMPIKVIFTHDHHDHIGQADQFIAQSEEYIGEPDYAVTVASLKRSGVAQGEIDSHLKALHDGDTIDIGDRKLIAYAAPGHTPGSMVILDPKTGNLFSGDSFGSNSPTIPDALFMQWYKDPLDVYLATVKTVREKLGDRVTAMMTGHNDHPLYGHAYLDNLETALQKLMDEGDAALIPSYRPVGAWQVMVGDRFTDVNWVAVNVNRDSFLPATPEKIARLDAIRLKGATLSAPFVPSDHSPVAMTGPGAKTVEIGPNPTSSHAQSVTVNGKPVTRGSFVAVSADQPAQIVVRSPDGTQSETYTLKFEASK